MSFERAERIAEKGSEREKSYISADDVASLFKFSGPVNIEELIYNGDLDGISLISISPKDESFDSIRVRIAQSGALFGDIDLMAKNGFSVNGSDPKPFVPFQLSDGSRGYKYGGGAVVRSLDGAFDLGIEIDIHEDRGEPVITDSNADLMSNLFKQSDGGLQFFKGAAQRIYPLAKVRYRERVRAIEEMKQAEDVVLRQLESEKGGAQHRESTSTGKGPDSEREREIIPSTTSYAETPQEHQVFSLRIVIGLIAVSIGSYCVIRFCNPRSQ